MLAKGEPSESNLNYIKDGYITDQQPLSIMKTAKLEIFGKGKFGVVNL